MDTLIGSPGHRGVNISHSWFSIGTATAGSTMVLSYLGMRRLYKTATSLAMVSMHFTIWMIDRATDRLIVLMLSIRGCGCGSTQTIMACPNQLNCLRFRKRGSSQYSRTITRHSAEIRTVIGI